MKKKFRGTRKFSELFADISKPAFSEHGFANYKIATYWHKILGSKLSRYTIPQKIIFKPGQTVNGVLHIGVSNPGMSLEIQASESEIIERISTFFGYQAVGRIRVNIAANAKSLNKEREKPDNREEISELEMQTLNKKINEIDDENLQAVLSSLASNLFKAQKKT